MREESLLSVGIDVGTSTTQCVFSRLTLKNTAPAFAMPRVSITEKQVLRRCPLRLTPLIGAEEIDAERLRGMIEEDYREAGVAPGDIRCGCIIVTGEMLRKRNARAVSQALSSLAGDFVVATAGPDLESMLAGRGSGAAELSSRLNKTVLNLDIGGGTTNMCVFEHGEPLSTGNLNIGGRLMRFEPGTKRILSFEEPVKLVAEDLGLTLRGGRTLDAETLGSIARRMALVLEEAVNLRERTELYNSLVLEHGFASDVHADAYTFSGGVGECVYGTQENSLDFNDIGECLGEAIRRTACFIEARVLRPRETQQATVIGAGAYSMAVSGSTIQYKCTTFPVKNLPAGKMRFSRAEDIASLYERAMEQRRVFDGECALVFEGLKNPTFAQIEAAADALSRALQNANTRVIIIRRDMAKALGQALIRRLGDETLVCIDGISLAYGDMVDIGAPLSEGRVLPVVVKTLAFSGGM